MTTPPQTPKQAATIDGAPLTVQSIASPPVAAPRGPKSDYVTNELAEALSEGTQRTMVEQGLHPADPRALSVAALCWIANASAPASAAQCSIIVEYTDALQLTPQSRERCMHWIAEPPSRTTALLCAETLRDAIAETGAILSDEVAVEVGAAAERVAQTTPRGRRAPMDTTETACVDAIVDALGTDLGMSWFELSQELG